MKISIFTSARTSAALCLVALLSNFSLGASLAAGAETPVPVSNFDSLFAATGIAESAIRTETDKGGTPSLVSGLGMSSLQRASLDASNRDILKILVSMQRLNTVFRMASTKQPYWRQARQTTYVETNSGCTLLGTIDAMRLHYANIHAPITTYMVSKIFESNGSVLTTVTAKTAAARKIRPALSQSIQEPQVVGNCVNLCGDVFELGVNAVRWRQLRASGLDSSSYRKRVIALRIELERAFERRDILQRELPEGSPEALLSLQEARLQEDLRDLLLHEYSQYHSSSTKLHWFQNAAYMLDFAKTATGATGGIISIEGNHLRLSRWSGGAAVFTTISGTLALMIPFAGRVAGNWASTVDRHIVSRDYGKILTASTQDIATDQANLASSMKQLAPEAPANRNLFSRAYGYNELAENMRDHEVNLRRLVKRAKSATVENFIYGGIVGSTKVSLGVCGILAGYRYYNRPWLASRLTAAGNTAYTAATGFSFLENIRVVGTQHYTNNRMKEQQLLPSQLYAQRLGRLDNVDSKLKSAEALPN